MGNIKVVFKSNGQIFEDDLDIKRGALKRKLQQLYSIQKIEKIEVPGDDFIIDIDLDNEEKEIDWNKFKYPDIAIKGKIEEIIYYESIRIKIEEILEKINFTRFDAKHELEAHANTLISVTEKIEESKYFSELKYINKPLVINSLKYAISKEGIELMEMKHKTSETKKANALINFKEKISNSVKSITIKLKYYLVDHIEKKG